MEYLLIAGRLILQGLYAVKQKDIVGFIRKVLLQPFLQRAVVTPGDIFNAVLVAMFSYQWEEVYT